MKKKITFQNMEHSAPMEAHANQKLDKLIEVLKAEKEALPVNIEMWLKSAKTHPHSLVEIHLKTQRFDLYSHSEQVDIYFAIDDAIDQMVKLYKKAKAKSVDKSHKVESEKKKFTETEDKYTLGD